MDLMGIGEFARRSMMSRLALSVVGLVARCSRTCVFALTGVVS
jgi:hypothetical protein